MRTVSCNSYLHAMGCQALWTGAECKRTMWEPCVRGGRFRSSLSDARAVLSLSFVEPNKRDRPDGPDEPDPRHAPRNVELQDPVSSQNHLLTFILLPLYSSSQAAPSGYSPAPILPARLSQVHDHGASAFPVSVLDARDGRPLHAQKRRDRLRRHLVAAPWGLSDQG